MQAHPSLIELGKSESEIEKWKYFIISLLKFLKMYKDILNSYVLDFYTRNLWENINASWKKSFETFTTTDLANFLNKKSNLRNETVLPLSLLAFRATCFSFSLPRESISGPSDVNEFFSSFINKSVVHEEHLMRDVPWQSPDVEFSPDGGQHYLLEHVFRKHLKPKKQHEVVRMSQISAKIFHNSNSEVIIDVGSGQGHLARLTSYGFGIPTLCIDAEENFTNGARKYDLELENSLKRSHSKKIVGSRHGTFRLHPDLTNKDFEEVLKETWPDLIEEKKNYEELPFSLVGLHCCGDLGPILLRLFASIPACRTLLLVGCCYMKLTSKSERETSEGYPMSQFVKSRNDSELSYTAKEMACHALEAYAARLKTGVDELKVHCYRAVLEKLIVEKNDDLRHSGLRSVKNAHLLSFKEYAVKAISRLEGISFEQKELESEDIEVKLKDSMKVVIFYSIRLLLAPVVESLILLDRLFFIQENNVKSCFVPIFDPKLSPRNYSLIATKD